MRTPGAHLPASFAAACLAGAVFVPAVPAGAARAPVPAPRPVSGDGTLSVCQAMTNSLATDSAWSFAVTPKSAKKAVAGGLVPNGTSKYPACRTILLPPGSYRVIETPKKDQPVVKVVVQDQSGATKAFTAKAGGATKGSATKESASKGKVRKSAPFRITPNAVTTVTFHNRQT